MTTLVWGGGTIYMRFSYKYLFRASAESSIKWGECFRLERWYRNARGVIGEEGGIKQNTRTVYRKQKQEKLKEGSGYRKEVYYRALSKQHIDMCCSSHTTAGWDDASSRRLLLVYYFHPLKRKKKKGAAIYTEVGVIFFYIYHVLLFHVEAHVNIVWTYIVHDVHTLPRYTVKISMW